MFSDYRFRIFRIMPGTNTAVSVDTIESRTWNEAWDYHEDTYLHDEVDGTLIIISEIASGNVQVRRIESVTTVRYV